MKSDIVLVTNFYKSNQGKHFTPITVALGLLRVAIKALNCLI